MTVISPTRLLIFAVCVISGCAIFGLNKLDKVYGASAPVARQVASVPAGEVDFWDEVKPVLDSRCVVCHGCYDAPCQLKLTAIEGLERGASKTPVYNNRRFLAGELTRLFEDATTVSEWREKDFFPILNERAQILEAHRHAGVMHQMLTLKDEQPLPDQPLLDNDFTLELNRETSCPKADEFDQYAADHPLWGMPYALPALTAKEQNTLIRWLEQGGTYTARDPLTAPLQEQIEQWEAFLNQPGLKSVLVSRYLYEHLFLANIHFSDTQDTTFFKLVRSVTPPGQPVERISTRRPYDDPESDTMFYRLLPQFETIVSKTHMPYALNQERRMRWQKWFFNDRYQVASIPGYNPDTAANPFITFKQIPADARYRFLLDEAHYTIKNFINGPVCRGPIALSVIRDHFWVFFMNPDSKQEELVAEFLSHYEEELALPSAEGSIYTPLTTWLKYSKKQKQHLTERDQFLSRNLGNESHFGLDTLWQGEGKNPNVALTVFRHFDSASVEKGMLGQAPQTAWVIGYPLLERIHYLLVAGYDVYGNVGHQLLSRLHMDFLRMEGEANFLMLLPQKTREQERHNWYREADKEVLQYLTHPSLEQTMAPTVEFKTDNHKIELYQKITDHLAPSLQQRKNPNSFADKSIRKHLRTLSSFSGEHTNLLPEVTFVEIVDNAQDSEFITILRNNAHLNMTALLSEKKTLLPSENTISVTREIVGSYPNALMRVTRDRFGGFVEDIVTLQSESDYGRLMDEYGVRRTAKDFWSFSDHLHNSHRQADAIEFGFFDFNRLENR